MSHTESKTTGKRIVVLLLLMLLLVFGCSSVAYAKGEDETASSGGGLVTEENLKNATKEKSSAIEEIEENAKNYALDKKEVSLLTDAGGNVGQWMASILYNASRGMGYYSAYLTKFSIDFDLF